MTELAKSLQLGIQNLGRLGGGAACSAYPASHATGIKRNRKHVWVSRRDVVAVAKLEDVVDV